MWVEVPPSSTLKENDQVPLDNIERPFWVGSLTWVTWGIAVTHASEGQIPRWQCEIVEQMWVLAAYRHGSTNPGFAFN